MIITSQKIILSDTKTIDNAAILIRRGIIDSVARLPNLLKKFPGHSVHDFQNSVLMPGLINAHTHLELPALLDTVRGKFFPDWVLNLIQAKKHLVEKDYAAAAADNIKSFIQTGTTTIGEISTHNVSFPLLKQAGLRAVVYQEVINMGPSRSSKFKARGSKKRSSLLFQGISPHSPYTVSEDVLRKIKKYSENKQINLCMHIAESNDEINLLSQKKSGLEKIYQFAGWDLDWAPRAHSSFEYLKNIGLLSPHLLAVHAVQVTDKDVELIKKTKVAVAHCPRSNNELGVGRMPLKRFLDAGITVGLGTDSMASSPSLSMWDEMRYALRIHKKDGVTARDIFKLATIGGAKALNLDKEIGALARGKKADIIAVPLPSKNTGDLFSDLLRETKSCIMTMVNGKILYLDEDSRR